MFNISWQEINVTRKKNIWSLLMSKQNTLSCLSQHQCWNSIFFVCVLQLFRNSREPNVLKFIAILLTRIKTLWSLGVTIFRQEDKWHDQLRGVLPHQRGKRKRTLRRSKSHAGRPVRLFFTGSVAWHITTKGSHFPVGTEGTAQNAIHLRRHAALWITSSKLTNAPGQSGI